MLNPHPPHPRVFQKIHPYLTLLLLAVTLLLLADRLPLRQQEPVQVKVTEVSQSQEPRIDPEMLQQLGERFLFRSVAEEVLPSVVFIEATVKVDPRYWRDRRRSMAPDRQENEAEEENGDSRQDDATQSEDARRPRSDRDTQPGDATQPEQNEGLRPDDVPTPREQPARDQTPRDEPDRDSKSTPREQPDRSSSFWDFFIHPRISTMGSGVLITNDGYILTNHHVINGVDADDIEVSLNDKRVYKARLIGSDPSTDIAVLKIDATDLEPVIIGNSDRVQVGDWVLAVGNPFRLRSTVTAGIVSATSRQVEIIDDALRIESFIQTDAAINRGNSGGALVNTSGELIGINTAIATQDGNNQGYGFAVPSNLSLKIARDLIEFGKPQRGLLGVSIQSITQNTARDLGLSQITGVRIIGLVEQGAAKEQGLRLNDVILNVNGFSVSEANQLQERVALHRPGEIVQLTVWRNGTTFTTDVPLRSTEALLDMTSQPEEPEDPVQPTLQPSPESEENEDR